MLNITRKIQQVCKQAHAKLKRQQQIEFISHKRLEASVSLLVDNCITQIDCMLINENYASTLLDIHLVSIARGGNIPTTLLHHKLVKAFKEEISRDRLNFHIHYLPISTREVDSNKGANKIALDNLNKVLDKANPTHVYIIDDLLDEGVTFHLIDKACCKSKWYKDCSYLYCFSKYLTEITPNRSQPVTTKKQPVYYLPQDIGVGEYIGTKAWLQFWYE